jgi:hypothetical protein
MLSDNHISSADAFENSREFMLAVEAADMGVWCWCPGTGCVELSPHGRTLLSVPRNYPLDYEGFLALINPDDRQATDEVLHASVAGRGEFDWDFRATSSRTQDGWLKIRGRVTSVANQSPEASSWISRPRKPLNAPKAAWPPS